ncbi:phosphomannomutase CpsG [Photobacterium sp. Hal280]|uniref:phosphomannomutase CpsG n=1 Tax=Photobacterium sp. Hal280 TaxID=3035163 RepID=UPI00301E1383
MKKLTCFKAYDIRGVLGDELNADIAYRIGRAFGDYLKARKVIVGGDIRISTPELKAALSEGLLDSGSDVVDIGLCGTEEIYFATKHLQADGGIEITASHNPINYNGMKLVRRGSMPISGDTGLFEIKRLAEDNVFSQVSQRGVLSKCSNLKDYVDHLMTYIKPESIKPLKIVVNAGNGAAGHVIDEIENRFIAQDVPVNFVKINHDPDGNFPNGIPNPLLPECRSSTSDAVIENSADLGIAWDGDFDRCFLFDHNGRFIEGYYIVGLLAESFLLKEKGAKIIFDPRLYWNTQEVIENNHGEPVMSKTGHAFIKERMRAEDAIYGGEMSAHHYFRDFAYCDSGMIPWLLITELLSVKERTLSDLVSGYMDAYPSSGEINFKVKNPELVIESIYNNFIAEATCVDKTDGIGMEFNSDEGAWRFNLRTSNTEAVVRLNVESKEDIHLMKRKTKDIISIINKH